MTENKYKIINKDIIKYFAMLAMLLNHVATIFLKTGTALCEIFTAIGYFTAITMIYFLVEGYYYTHSKRKYIARLFVFALISEVPYCLAFTEGKVIGYYDLNMFFTLCLCFGIIWVSENVVNKILRICLFLLGILLSVDCSWAIMAPVMTLLFIYARQSEKRTKAAFCISVLIFAAFNLLGGLYNFSVMENIIYALLGMLGMGSAGLCIMFFYNGKQSSKCREFPKWFFYIFYPAHLLILGIIRIFMFKTAS